MIRSSTKFNFNGFDSDLFGVYNISIDGGLHEEIFLPTRRIIKTSIRGRPNPYHQDVEYDPIEFDLAFYFKDKWNNKKIRETARWLYGGGYYAPLYFYENPERWFYGMFTGESTLVHNGLREGYARLHFECNSPFSFSPIYETGVLDYSTNPSGTEYTFANGGDEDLKPRLFIEKVGNGDVKIVNHSKGGEYFELVDLLDGELITVDHDQESIETDISLRYLYDHQHGDFLTLPYGNAYLEIFGNCRLKWVYQYRWLTG